jgi:MFS family permease
MINFASQLGKAMGAFYGGRLIQTGRKKVYIFGNVMSIVSCLLMQIVSMFTLFTGKFLNGFFVTVVHMAQIKMINETVPVYLLGTCGPIV